MLPFEHLLGLDYVAGRQDCYTCARGFYKLAGLDLPNFARPQFFWQSPDLDLYAGFRDFGFRLVFEEEPAPGDLLLMPLLAAVNSHAAVAVGRNEILHHPPGQLSRVDPYRPKWSMRTMVHARHPDVYELLKPKVEQVHIHEALNAAVFRDPTFQDQVARVLAERG